MSGRRINVDTVSGTDFAELRTITQSHNMRILIVFLTCVISSCCFAQANRKTVTLKTKTPFRNSRVVPVKLPVTKAADRITGVVIGGDQNIDSVFSLVTGLVIRIEKVGNADMVSVRHGRYVVFLTGVFEKLMAKEWQWVTKGQPLAVMRAAGQETNQVDVAIYKKDKRLSENEVLEYLKAL